MSAELAAFKSEAETAYAELQTNYSSSCSRLRSRAAGGNRETDRNYVFVFFVL
jgi:hypothetical protein